MHVFAVVQLVRHKAMAAGAMPVNTKSLLELMPMTMLVAAAPSLNC